MSNHSAIRFFTLKYIFLIHNTDVNDVFNKEEQFHESFSIEDDFFSAEKNFLHHIKPTHNNVFPP